MKVIFQLGRANMIVAEPSEPLDAIDLDVVT